VTAAEFNILPKTKKHVTTNSQSALFPHQNKGRHLKKKNWQNQTETIFAFTAIHTCQKIQLEATILNVYI